MTCCVERLSAMSRRVASMVMCLVLVACGGGGSPLPQSPDVVLENPSSGANVMKVYVDAGPGNNEVNRLYTDITICQPGSTTNCQTIEHVLVDTGSTGLRILSSALNSGLTPTPITSSNQRLVNCVQFLDGSHAWGPMARVDLQLGGETISNLPVQLMGDAAYASTASRCGAAEDALTSASELGAQAVLGISHFANDCGESCTSNSGNGYYYQCSTADCTSVAGTTASLDQQLANPVPRLSANHNGFVVNLPPVPAPGAGTLRGEIILGIGTQENNLTGSVKLLSTDGNGYVNTRIDTTAAQATYSDAFIDTGSNGIYFDNNWSALSPCGSEGPGFYCPASDVSLRTSMTGQNSTSATVDFTVSNAGDLFAARDDAVIPNLSGPVGDSAIFDWGLPFYFGRKVYQGLQGKTATVGTQTATGPFIAFQAPD